MRFAGMNDSPRRLCRSNIKKYFSRLNAVNSSQSSAIARIAERMSRIAPFQVMEVQARAHQLEMQGRRIIHMEIGQPDFGAPPQVVEAAVTALNTYPMGYTGALGLPALREAIARHYVERFSTPVAADSVVVTPGASGALLLLLGVLIDPGDEVLMTDPCYPCNRHFVRLYDGVPVALPVGPGTQYQPTLAQIETAWGPRTRGVLIASPSNPTGTLIPQSELAAIADWLARRGGFLLVDEIYQGLTYDVEPQTALRLAADNVFVVNSFSKYFCMTGWRLGWLTAPAAYMRDIEKLAQNIFICPSTPAQHAALAAFRADTIEVLELRREEFRRRRDFMLPALQDLGFSVAGKPGGAFYIYADCSELGADSAEVSRRALEEAGVAITPGFDFGTHGANRHVRFAYTRSANDLSEGMARLQRLFRV